MNETQTPAAEAPAKPVQLRKNPPYFCRYDSADIGAPKQLCLAPLAETDGEKCAAHTRGPIWPLNDDGSACTPNTATQEVA